MRSSDRPSGLLLAATWGSRSAPSSCTAYFVRSFVALPSPRRTELRILFDPSSLSPGEVWPCENEPPHDGLVTYVPIPEDWRRRLRVLGIWRNLDQYRVHLFNWLMQNMTVAGDLERYGYIGALDTDIIFQIDPFDAWHPQVRGRHELLLSAENPVDDNDGGQALAKLGIVRRAPGAESYLWSWEVKPSAMRPATSDKGKPSRAPASPPPPDCRYVYEVPPSPLHPAGVHRQPQVQADYWRLFGQTERLNFGTLLGTRSAMVHLFDVFLRAVTRFKMNGKLSIGTAIYCHCAPRELVPSHTPSSCAHVTHRALHDRCPVPFVRPLLACRWTGGAQRFSVFRRTPRDADDRLLPSGLGQDCRCGRLARRAWPFLQ